MSAAITAAASAAAAAAEDVVGERLRHIEALLVKMASAPTTSISIGTKYYQDRSTINIAPTTNHFTVKSIAAQ